MLNHGESETTQDFLDYVSNRSLHYSDSDIELVDYLASIGTLEGFCIANVMKYVGRFGKKYGKNKEDLMKAMHYICYLYYFEFIKLSCPENDKIQQINEQIEQTKSDISYGRTVDPTFFPVPVRYKPSDPWVPSDILLNQPLQPDVKENPQDHLNEVSEATGYPASMLSHVPNTVKYYADKMSQYKQHKS